MRVVDLVLVEIFEVPKLWTNTFSVKHKVMVVVICILRVEGSMDKG
jgi:hypothetical protein